MRFLTAHRVFSGKNFLAEGSVLILDDQNCFAEIVSENELDPNTIERFEGILSPGFVNAHCHLELSHLKDKISRGTGLPGFAGQVVAQRNKCTREEVQEQLNQADSAMWNNGIVAVGDISNTADSFEKKTQSKLFYHTFIELIGLKPEQSSAIFEKGIELLNTLKSSNLSGSLAPHAPYSTSKELIQQIAAYDHLQNKPFSIHNQESEEETKFFMGEENAFQMFYSALNLDLSWYVAPKTSSLKQYADVLSNGNSLLIHNTFTRNEDIAHTNTKPVFWCFCPGANLYIEERLPDFTVFGQLKDKICLGTDSLASNSELNVLQEANLILSASNSFSQEELLRAVTYNGALALGITQLYGGFIPGKNAGINLVDFSHSKINFLKKIA